MKGKTLPLIVALVGTTVTSLLAQIALPPGIGGPANGGPLEKETFGETFSLYSWTGNANDAPQVLIPDLRHYTIRPEGVDLIQVAGQWHVLFAEDRFKGTGYASRNAVHWPISILGNVP